MKYLKIAVSIIAIICGLVLTSDSVSYANSNGQLLYTPTSANESNAYARTIELHHAGSNNGRLLATFEHWTNDGSPAAYIIRASDNNGGSWHTLTTVPDQLTGTGHPASHMWQPFLFEFPKELGSYPAGTIMLAGNTVPADGSYTEFQMWRSFDYGKTWKAAGVLQKGGPGGKGIWEPFLSLDSEGQLVMEFSDERDSPAHSQMLSQMVSNDGGKTWGSVTHIVASAVAADRPGMTTVARIGNYASYVMSYEVCGRANCAVHLKFSRDGKNWGNPTDLGSRVETNDGYYLGHSPFITWVPNGSPQGELILAAQRVYDVVDNQPAAGDYQSVFVNTHGGTGSWSWSPAPWQVSTTSSSCNANYSPDLLPVGPGGMVRYTAPTSVPGQTACGEATAVSDIGVLPYHSTFSTTGQAGWIMYGGSWSVNGNTLQETSGGNGGNKAVTGSTAWRNYQMDALVNGTSAGSVPGVAVRVSQPASGADSYRGYLVFYDTHVGTFTIAREDYAYEPLASATVPGGIHSNAWYRITVRVTGNQLQATLAPKGSKPAASLSFKDPYNSFPTGMVALRDFAGTASWQNITVSALH
ncbi:MAG TPA: sialidase family protein [Ktedonobacteraceae bacterium]|nr:sialidase family protein [Ktedonobacteraceae bacterium]